MILNYTYNHAEHCNLNISPIKRYCAPLCLVSLCTSAFFFFALQRRNHPTWQSNCCLLIWPNLIFAGSRRRFGEFSRSTTLSALSASPPSVVDCDLTIVGIFVRCNMLDVTEVAYRPCLAKPYHPIPSHHSTYLPLCETCAMMRSPCLASSFPDCCGNPLERERNSIYI